MAYFAYLDGEKLSWYCDDVHDTILTNVEVTEEVCVNTK